MFCRLLIDSQKPLISPSLVAGWITLSILAQAAPLTVIPSSSRTLQQNLALTVQMFSSSLHRPQYQFNYWSWW
ncbi:hypothetical protein PPACK8108_LOCUS3705 [Phakopsora pachyrhizi]|uniref:Secreted protein n=1 Tax=Phakopsora pachyrhizi TaxID=170000 RepID=A0AAV0ANA4_PHAPC|nr:hypothetical protein PPACK8108_LOCUS3705 [Phakopsora pachyrhizi]